MRFDTQTSARYALDKLDLLFERASRDTAATFAAETDIPAAVTYYVELRDTVKEIAEKVSALQKLVESVSHEYLPTMFKNNDTTTITVDGVGRATVNQQTNCKMLDKAAGFGWLRQTGNQGMITETVNAKKLGGFARDEIDAGRLLPDEIFQVTTMSYMSVTK